MAAKAPDRIESVSAQPEKNFFVEMLTRDIELQDAILDLLDNCVDGATRTLAASKQSTESLGGFWAKITLSKDRFTIEDNCGGIPWKIAHEYAFNLGKPEKAQRPEGTIGVVGIGMKRAIFKMGRRCHVHSHHEEDSFLVMIEPSWFDSREWKPFPAEREKPRTKNFGTIIEIEELEDDISLAFSPASLFVKRLEKTIAEAYAYLIERGFAITLIHVGDSSSKKPQPIKGDLLSLCFENGTKTNLIRPFFFQAKYNNVHIFFAVGYRSGLESDADQDEDRESSYPAGNAGWTVLCNDRVVLSNDRTIKTGWESAGVPRFHNQFSCIAGIIDFQSFDTKELPITTTKRGIDMGKEVYLFALNKMQEGTKCFTRNTNSWKGYEKELKSRFDDAPRLKLTDLRKRAQALFTKVSARNGSKQYKPDLPTKKKNVTTRRICFVRQIADIEAVSQFLTGQSLLETTPNQVGEECFDRCFKQADK
jgi:hypothetical protein